MTTHSLTATTGLGALEELRLRAGVNCGLTVFTSAVCDAYNYVRHIPDDVVVDRFQSCGSQDALRRALHAARPVLERAREILFVGCGAGLGGRPASVARSVIGEMPEFTGARVELMDLSAESVAMGLPYLHSRPPFDVLITHSFVHYLLEPRVFLESVAARIAPGGVYIMAHEPNRRFFQTLAKPQQEERVSPLQRLRSLSLLPRRRSTAHRVNQMLRRRLGLRHDLSIDEIRGIVDPHSPITAGHSCLFGSPGLDWDELKSTFFSSFDLEWIGTYGVSPREDIGRKGRNELISGPLFSAAWRRLVPK